MAEVRSAHQLNENENNRSLLVITDAKCIIAWHKIIGLFEMEIEIDNIHETNQIN